MTLWLVNVHVLQWYPCNGHPWDLQKWLLYSGDLIIQSGYYVIAEWKQIELVAVIEKLTT